MCLLHIHLNRANINHLVLSATNGVVEVGEGAILVYIVQTAGVLIMDSTGSWTTNIALSSIHYKLLQHDL